MKLRLNVRLAIPLLIQALLSKLDRSWPENEWIFLGFSQFIGDFQSDTSICCPN